MDKRPFSYFKNFAIKEDTKENESNRISVTYISDMLLDGEALVYYFNAFEIYMKDIYLSGENNIINIVNGIREITKDLDEKQLEVVVRHYEYESENTDSQGVLYQYGDIVYAQRYSKKGYDKLEVSTTKDRTTVYFDKEGIYLDNKEKIELINKELESYYDMVLTLCSMTKKNEKSLMLEL